MILRLRERYRLGMNPNSESGGLSLTHLGDVLLNVELRPHAMDCDRVRTRTVSEHPDVNDRIHTWGSTFARLGGSGGAF